jgi:hypothetical protein
MSLGEGYPAAASPTSRSICRASCTRPTCRHLVQSWRSTATSPRTILVGAHSCPRRAQRTRFASRCATARVLSAGTTFSERFRAPASARLTRSALSNSRRCRRSLGECALAPEVRLPFAKPGIRARPAVDFGDNARPLIRRRPCVARRRREEIFELKTWSRPIEEFARVGGRRPQRVLARPRHPLRIAAAHAHRAG